MEAYRFIRETLEKQEPEIFQALYPRIYRGVEGWCAPAIPATCYGSVLCAWREGLARDLYSQMHAATAATLIKYGTPAYHVSRDLALAVAQTEPPEDLRWTDIGFPFPAGIFLFPDNLIRDERGYSYGFVAWCRVYANRKIPVPGAQQAMAFHNDALLFTTTSVNDPNLGGLVKSLDANTWTSARLAETDEISNLVGAEREMANYLAHLALGLLLLLEVKPEIRDPGKRLSAARGNRVTREIWEPHWVGRDYQVARSVPQGGTHASPRMHWRRGHWRHQRYGVELRESKRIWIEPILVAGKELVNE